MKQRIVCAILALSLFAGIFTSCGKPDASPSTSAQGGSQPAAGNEKPVEIDVMVWERGDNAPNTTVTDNATVKYIQEQVLAEKNVKVNFVSTPRADSEDKLTAMLAGGNAPDLVLSYERPLFMNFVSKGGLTDLTDLIEAHGPNIKAALKDTNYAGVVDGRQYAVMSNRSRQQSRHMAYIRKDWLDKLELPVPATKEELVDTLRQFKEKDPAGLGDKNIPYGMSGRQIAEQYLMFVSSYATGADKNTKYLYNESTRIMQPGCDEGFRVLNEMYNEGLISKDFAVDTNGDKFSQDIANGSVGFFVDDVWRVWDLGSIGALRQQIPESLYVPLNIFTNEEGVIENVANSAYGMYKMVPKTSEEKAEAVVKYLDWLSVEENALAVQYTPEYTIDAEGIPLGLTDEELRSKGYAVSSGDFNIVTANFDFNNDYEKLTTSYLRYDWKADFTRDEVKDILVAQTADLVNWPVYETNMEATSKYGAAVKTACIEMAFKCISAPSGTFDAVYQEEYNKVMQAGFETMLEENKAYCEQYVK